MHTASFADTTLLLYSVRYRLLKKNVMTTVKELRELLATMPDDYEVVIYPKYSSDKVDGYRKHRFRIDQVCEQEPFAVSIKDDADKLKTYFGCKDYEEYEVNNHVAILF